MPQRPERDWIIRPPHAERARLAAACGLPPLLAQLLLVRGMGSADEVGAFLDPRLAELNPPEQLPGASAAGKRLLDAVRAGRRIVIYGDYDVDGVTATTILWRLLKLAGAQVTFYVPSRFEEGYGLNSEALRKLAADGAQLVITVDCGITALQEAQVARELGVELIITDHHTPKAALPAADVIVHPSALGPSPNPDLCGAGVALKVAWAFAQHLSDAPRVRPELRAALLDAMAFAALGLVADLVPLTGENRIIASYGLRQLCRSENPGVRALLEVSGLSGKAACDDYDVGFTLGPRLNAVGRMGHARLAVELFTRADAARALEIAQALDKYNRQRQGVERTIARQAEKMVIERGFDRDGCRGIVLASDAWHVGVIGIVASRMVDRFRRPAVLIALDNGVGQGSGRSIRHFPLNEVLQCCEEHLTGHGGHAMAAGVRLRADQVDAFTQAFQHEAGQRLTAQDLRPRLYLDDEVGLDELRSDAIEPLLALAPFGPGNPRPLLATGPVEIADAPRVVGASGNHMQLALRQGGVFRKAIVFNGGAHAEEFAQHRHVRLAFEPIVNEWNGNRRLELRVQDWKWAD